MVILGGENIGLFQKARACVLGFLVLILGSRGAGTTEAARNLRQGRHLGLHRPVATSGTPSITPAQLESAFNSFYQRHAG